MDILLLVITVVSLLIAVFLGIAAWGMWREERARSAARVATLIAAADDEEVPAAQKPRSTATVTAPKVAPWNPPPDWQRLPRAASTPPPDVPVERSHRAAAHADTPDAGVRGAFLGSAIATPASSRRQQHLSLAAIALFVALVAGAYSTFDGDRQRTTDTMSAGSPLELISLRHERDGGGLAITGLVRNPGGGRPVEGVSAVALLFDQKGEFVTSSRAGIDFTQLAPGDESPFVVRLDAPSNVARYRVSFRTDAGVVPHIDRRGQEPIARDVP